MWHCTVYLNVNENEYKLMSEKNVSLQREGTGEDGLPTEGKEHASTYKKYRLSPTKEVFSLIWRKE